MLGIGFISGIEIKKPNIVTDFLLNNGGNVHTDTVVETVDSEDDENDIEDVTIEEPTKIEYKGFLTAEDFAKPVKNVECISENPTQFAIVLDSEKNEPAPEKEQVTEEERIDFFEEEPDFNENDFFYRLSRFSE